MVSHGRLPALLVSLFAIAAVAVGQNSRSSVPDSGPPLVNWHAPSTYTPARGTGAHPLAIQSGELGAGPYAFFPMTPCRQYDSRNFSPLADNTPRTIQLSGAPCGIPNTSQAVSVNITVFSIAGATGNGVFKVGIVMFASPTTAWINYPPSETQRANAGILATDGAGNIVVQVNQGGGSVNFTVDVNGYYYNGNASNMPQGDIFQVQGDVNRSGYGAIQGFNLNQFQPNSYGVVGITNSTGDSSAGVYGAATGTDGGPTYGVVGASTLTAFSAGVRGEGDSFGQTTGVQGVCTFSGPPTSLCTGVAGSGIGAGGNFSASGNGGYGVQATALDSTSGQRGYGVIGNESSVAPDSAGVRGVDASGPPAPLGSTGYVPAGVRGESATGFGTIGVSQIRGSSGTLVNSVGTLISGGLLGYSGSGGPWGVFAQGDIGASGAKPFVEVHPTDPNKLIRYVALEGPEAGTYFRGSAETYHSMAVIPVPESFRLVTDIEGLTVQLTPIGAPATLYIVSQDLNQIVVHSSQDVRFHYLVNGVRQTFKDWQVVVDGGYMPESPKQTIPGYFNEEQKRRLISNGTYNPDGTVNMTTAERVGWTKIWADRKAAAEAAAAKNAASAQLQQGQPQKN